VRRELLAWLLAKKEDHVGGGDSGFGLYALLSSLLAEVVINHSRQLQQQVRERERREETLLFNYRLHCFLIYLQIVQQIILHWLLYKTI
jgi:hypothetical protein